MFFRLDKLLAVEERSLCPSRSCHVAESAAVPSPFSVATALPTLELVARRGAIGAASTIARYVYFWPLRSDATAAATDSAAPM